MMTKKRGVLLAASVVALAGAVLALLRASSPAGGSAAEASWAGNGSEGPATSWVVLAAGLAVAAAALAAIALRPAPRSRPSAFFTTAEKKRIREAIARAEATTAGEIRVHLARRTTGDVLTAAKNAFVTLRMDATEARTGLLIYLSVEDRRFAIAGDVGIDRVVPDTFWDGLREEMAALFAADRFVDGILLAVTRVGDVLCDRVPARRDDLNELSDEVSTD